MNVTERLLWNCITINSVEINSKSITMNNTEINSETNIVLQRAIASMLLL